MDCIVLKDDFYQNAELEVLSVICFFSDSESLVSLPEQTTGLRLVRNRCFRRASSAFRLVQPHAYVNGNYSLAFFRCFSVP